MSSRRTQGDSAARAAARPQGGPDGRRWLRQWAPAILWAALIWTFSTDTFSSGSTSRILLPLLQWLFPTASPHELKLLHAVTRKCAHFLEYFVFSLLLLRAMRAGRDRWKLRWAILAVLIAAAYASLDEVHQFFVPDRTSSPLDSLLDTSGAATAQLLAWLHARRQSRPTSLSA